MLVIVDQHAADERIRIENLLAELCTPHEPQQDGMPSESGIVAMNLEKNIVFEVSDKDIELLSKMKRHFAGWGICYDLPSPNTSKTESKDGIRTKQAHRLIIRTLPPGIIERCKGDPKLLIEIIRTELYSKRPSHSHTPTTTPNLTSSTDGNAWFKRIHTCPQGILDMLNSRACRSAIMFNDLLSKEQCEVLVKRLAETAFPFQCAHGRPSLLPLVELGSVPTNIRFEEMREGSGDFGRTFKAWKSSLNIRE
jgi:DNA mismatch repair protein MLH3